MSLLQNKETVQSFFERFSQTDVEGAMSLVHADVVWQAMGRAGDPPVSGTMDTTTGSGI